MRVVLVSTFGIPAFGVSPYADQLLSSLRDCVNVGDSIEPLDYQKPYPDFLYPAKAPKRQRTVGLHWAKPATWKCPMPAPDVLHIQYWTQIMAPMLVRLALSAKRYGVRIVVTVHNAQPHESSGFFARFEHTLLELADAVITHLPAEPISRICSGRHYVIPHGVDFRHEIRPTSRDFDVSGLDSARRYVLFFGNIRPYKGVLDLLEVWHSIAARFPEHDLIIAGRVWAGSKPLSRLSGRLLGLHRFEREYHAVCQRVYEDRVHFYNDYLSERFIDACCRIAELAVFPYRCFDAQSGAASRVAGFGRPMLVSDAGGLAQLVPDQRHIFRAGDISHLQSRLSTLLSRPSAEIAADVSAQRRHLEELAWPVVAKRHWALYERLIGTEP